MRFIILLSLLVFPIVEIWILISLMDEYGWWVVLYLVVIAILGLRMLRDEKLLFSGRMMQSLAQGANPVKAIFGSARNIIAAILLIIPGIMTDILAFVLLLIPTHHHEQAPPDYQSRSGARNNQAANDDVIEGEFHRED
jgi:UPF0716 protein FxsA